jgi:hypothetical protein
VTDSFYNDKKVGRRASENLSKQSASEVVSRMTPKIILLIKNAKRSINIAFTSLDTALDLVHQITTIMKGLPIELYTKFENTSSDEIWRIEKLLERNVKVYWSPDIREDAFTLDGILHLVERDEIVNLGVMHRFNKAGYFRIIRGKLIKGQNLSPSSSFDALLVLEKERNRKYPFFINKENLDPNISPNTEVEMAFISIIADRTLSGAPPPMSVFLECIAIKSFGQSDDGNPLEWINARDVIDGLLNEMNLSKEDTRRQDLRMQTKKKIQSYLKKNLIYVELDDERYINKMIDKTSVSEVFRIK